MKNDLQRQGIPWVFATPVPKFQGARLFPQTSPVISGSFEERHPQEKASWTGSFGHPIFVTNEWGHVQLFLTVLNTVAHCNALQHIRAHCNTVEHTATRCSTLQRTAAHGLPRLSLSTICNNTAHCKSLQRPATHCNALQHTAMHYNTLQRTTTHCNAFQRTATATRSPTPSSRHHTKLY